MRGVRFAFLQSWSAGLLAYLVWHAGPGKLWHNLVRLGWGFTLVIVLTGLSHLARTWTWHTTLGKGRHKLSFPKLVGLRLGAEAAGQLGIVGQGVMKVAFVLSVIGANLGAHRALLRAHFCPRPATTV
jgi:hypothetical protein